MKNNLSWLIPKAGLTKVEFGKLLFPEMKSETKLEKGLISNKVNKYCKAEKFPVKLMESTCKILDCDYNTLFGYEKE